MFNNYYLKYFIDAIELGSLTKSAKKNHVSVAAVSQAIKNLEASFQIEIMIHGKNTLELTSSGKLFFEKSKHMMKDITYYYESIISQSHTSGGKIFFALNSALATILLPRVLVEMKRKYPEIKIDFKAGYSTSIKHYILEGEVDFGININYIHMKECRTLPLFSGKFICIKKKGSSREQNFIVTEKGSEVSKFKKSYQKYYNTKPQIEMDVSSWEVIIKMAIQGIGIGIIPDFYLWDLDKTKYSIHTMPFELPVYDVNIYHLKKKSINLHGERLIQQMNESINLLHQGT